MNAEIDLVFAGLDGKINVVANVGDFVHVLVRTCGCHRLDDVDIVHFDRGFRRAHLEIRD